LDPAPRDPVKKDSRLAGKVEDLDPLAPKARKPFCVQNPIKSLPADGVEGFTEVEFKNCGWRSSAVTGLDDVGSINKIFGNGALRDEARLIRVNNEGNEVAESNHEAFGVNFEATILKRYRTEIVRFISPLFFREKHDVRLVYRAKISCKGVKVCKTAKQQVLDKIPVFFVEGRPKTIRPRARIVIHGEESNFYLIQGERRYQGGRLGGGEGGGSD
jgi:hypothetical protein